MLYASLFSKILIVAVLVIVFILVTFINLKVKKPKVEESEDCGTCDFSGSCPIHNRGKNNDCEKNK